MRCARWRRRRHSSRPAWPSRARRSARSAPPAGRSATARPCTCAVRRPICAREQPLQGCRCSAAPRAVSHDQNAQHGARSRAPRRAAERAPLHQDDDRRAGQAQQLADEALQAAVDRRVQPAHAVQAGRGRVAGAQRRGVHLVAVVAVVGGVLDKHKVGVVGHQAAQALRGEAGGGGAHGAVAQRDADTCARVEPARHARGPALGARVGQEHAGADAAAEHGDAQRPPAGPGRPDLGAEAAQVAGVADGRPQQRDAVSVLQHPWRQQRRKAGVAPRQRDQALVRHQGGLGRRAGCRRRTRVIVIAGRSQNLRLLEAGSCTNLDSYIKGLRCQLQAPGLGCTVMLTSSLLVVPGTTRAPVQVCGKRPAFPGLSSADDEAERYFNGCADPARHAGRAPLAPNTAAVTNAPSATYAVLSSLIM